MPIVTFNISIEEPGFTDGVEYFDELAAILTNAKSGQRREVTLEDCCEVELPSGSWALSLKDTGVVVDHAQTIEIGENAVSVGLDLVSYDGLLEVDTNDTVFVDGHEVGIQMIGGYRLPPGTFAITTDDSKYLGKELIVQIKSCQTTYANFGDL